MAARLCLVFAVALGTLMASCSLGQSLAEATTMKRRLEQAGYSNVEVGANDATKNSVRTRTLTVEVARPQDSTSDERTAAQVASAALESSPNAAQFDRLVVVLAGSGSERRFERSPAEWRELKTALDQPPGIVDIVLSKGVRGDRLEPVDPTTAFPADQPEFHAVVSVRNMPAETPIKAVWTAVDTRGATRPNQTINTTEGKTEGSRNIHFSIKPNAGKLPVGSYKVDVYWGDKLERSVPFTVGA